MQRAVGSVARRELSLAVLMSALSAACGSEPASPRAIGAWTLVLQDLPAALLSISGRSDSDVWAVGARLDDTALALHYDGEAWRRVAVAADADLWWVHCFEGGPVFIAGDRGFILRGEGESFEALPTPDSTATIYGVWGANADALWAVGTDGTNGVIWRGDRDGFEVFDVEPELVEHTTLFKVWGRRDDDLYMVGDQGRILHFDGERVTAMPSGTENPLITVHGTTDATYAVGGLGGSVVLGLESGAWVDLTPANAPAVNGVAARGDDAYVVGVFGEVLHRTNVGKFERLETGLDLAREYHAVWVDDAGGVWAVGGHVNDAPLVQGLLSYSGQRRLPSLSDPL